jgi:hypothetical protein
MFFLETMNFSLKMIVLFAIMKYFNLNKKLNGITIKLTLSLMKTDYRCNNFYLKFLYQVIL